MRWTWKKTPAKAPRGPVRAGRSPEDRIRAGEVIEVPLHPGLAVRVGLDDVSVVFSQYTILPEASVRQLLYTMRAHDHGAIALIPPSAPGAEGEPVDGINLGTRQARQLADLLAARSRVRSPKKP